MRPRCPSMNCPTCATGPCMSSPARARPRRCGAWRRRSRAADRRGNRARHHRTGRGGRPARDRADRDRVTAGGHRHPVRALGTDHAGSRRRAAGRLAARRTPERRTGSASRRVHRAGQARRHAGPARGPLLRAHAAAHPGRHHQVSRPHRDDAAQAAQAFPGGADGLRDRLAPDRRGRLPRVELGRERDQPDRCARHHDADRGHCRPSRREQPARRAREHHRRRPLPRPAQGHAARRGRANPTAPGWRSPRTTSAPAISAPRGDWPN